jgi:glutathione S-transferase
MRLYDDPCSGNGYKVRLILALLGRDYDYVPLDIDKAETRTSAFLAKNPNGRIPLLELDDGRLLAESNAILHYLADGSAFLPADRFDHAQVLQWMFFEQYSHEPNIATTRFWLTHGFEMTPSSRIGGAEKGGRLRGAGRDGRSSAITRFFRRRYLHDRRHRALRLYPCGP